MAAALGEILASRAIEEPEDPAEYGLNEPLCTISVAAGDTTHVLELGDETSLGGERYASIGDGKVYLVDESLLDTFAYGLYDLVEEEALPTIDNVTALSIDAETQKLKIAYLPGGGLCYSDEYLWYLESEDGYVNLDNELTEDLLGIYQNFEWAECVDYRAEDLAQYGLEEPTAVVTIDYDVTYQVDTGETSEDGSTIYETQTMPTTFTLEIGSYAGDGYCYARLAGSDMVYTVDASLSDSALYTTADTLLPDEVILLDFDQVTAMDILLDGATYTLRAETVTESDDEGNTTESTVWYLDGERVYPTDLITLLENLSSGGYATGLEPERSEEIRFVFHRENEKYPEVELSFHTYDSTHCITQLNGTSTVLALREEITALIEKVNSVVLK